jgi:starch synthase
LIPDEGASNLKVLAVASEIFPIIKTGGLADVTGALPGALAPLGIEVRTLIPGYRSVMPKLVKPRTVHRFDDLFGGPASIRPTRIDELDLLVLDAPHLFDRDGGPYNAPGGADWPDNPQRFAALSQAAAAICRGALPKWQPHVVHAHDWQAGFVHAYLAYDGGAPFPGVFTIHNLAFQGYCGVDMLRPLGFPPESFTVDGLEFYGGLSPLKAGIRLATKITTVSPTYAAEITRPEDGQGLDGLLRTRFSDLSGITNGIDTTVWNPANDELLPHKFATPTARRRGRNKAALQAQFGLDPEPAALLFGIVSRLTGQKGIDLVLQAIPALLQLGAQLVVFGSGEAALEAGLTAAASRHPGRVAVRIGYDEALAHLLQAGTDALLVPSRFEPCGLTQLCAQRYGAIPVVSRVGGLADTVVDANPAALATGAGTGIQFLPVSVDGLTYALRRTAALWADQKVWANLQRNAMRAEVGWEAAASAYETLYREIRN